MSKDIGVTGQLEALRKKLSSAISQRQSLETTRQEQVATLASLISKLSLVCKGIDIELDNRLAGFRRLLQQGAGYTDLNPIIDELVTLVSRHETSVEEQFTQLQASIQKAGVRLQQRKGVPDESRRNLRELLNKHLVNIKTPMGLIPLFERLVNIYDEVLCAKDAVTDNDATGKVNAEVRRFSDELMELCSEISVQGDLANMVTNIKTAINHASDLEQLLNASVELMRVIILSLSQERKSAQNFLSALNQSLADLQQLLINTADKSRQIDERIKDVYRQIDDNITALSAHTEQATCIEDLKGTVELRLASLTKQLVDKEQLEAQQRDTLQQGLQSMRSRVKDLEQQVESYETTIEKQRLMSLQDALTRLPNRLAFDERLDIELNHVKRTNVPVSLVVIDVDHFKSINDTYGHSAGDKTLLVLASAMKKAIRNTDFIARFGGEEFVIIMPHVGIEHIERPLEKLRSTIRSIPFKFKNKQVQITVSIGATQILTSDTALSAFDRADNALYEAKNSGRDRLIIKQ
ncbi:diguanylate cyclase [Pseudoalteromonas sp. SSDWG2]|uniref:GGDEF domain-containing protein n=1 Tax=Pseudoalteromonas sp. SSDWG2 TaxID=3139391 RepID=UPI003BA88D77